MSDFSVEQAEVDERRQYERIGVPYEAQVFLFDKKDQRIGVVRQLGRGGMMIEPETEFKKDKEYTATLEEKSEGIQRRVKFIVRRVDARYAGVEFVDMDADTAVEVGILIGKYYSGASKA